MFNRLCALRCHLPKCGSSFINTLTHMPGMCPSASSWTIGEDWGGHHWLFNFYNICPAVCDETKFICPPSDHMPIRNFTAEKGHLVGFFRDPDQRILSGYLGGSLG